MFNSFPFLILIVGLKNVLLSPLIIICLCSITFFFKCWHNFLISAFRFSLKENKSNRTISSMLWSTAEIAYIPIYRVAYFRCIWHSIQFQQHRLMLSRITDITQGILCLLIVCSCYLSVTFVTHSFPSPVSASNWCHHADHHPLLCMFCSSLQKESLVFLIKGLFPSTGQRNRMCMQLISNCIWCWDNALPLKNF